ncbi:hypothetical protein [Roseomonas sp. CECT 9278]|uniref:hypothetical protein n=1 Tax=Roseomonas sp. CECT 9278 TaxID=2845823 RepID=UPI001E3864B6|nr:hypothetical protein [Roseomonas sp. CECT 9278]CAH0300950.1 hypothetical protein ROS9278_04549 [Roseomonas sp. CECT 9278]
MTHHAPPDDHAAIAALVARHAPAARRFLAWRAAEELPALLAAARRGHPDWVIGLEPDEAQIAVALATLPPDPCLHLRGHPAIEPPAPGFAHPIVRRWFQGLQPDVVLLGPAAGAIGISAAARVLPQDGLLLAPPATAEDAAARDAAFVDVDRSAGLVALRPRRAAPPPPRRPPGRCAIVVTVVGRQTEAEWEITGPSVRAYATSIDAELVVAREGAGLPGPVLKSRAVPLAEAFDRIVMMDADILVRPHAPDLFAVVPPAAVGAYPEARHFPRAEIAREAAALHGIAPFPPEDYFNAGLLVLSRAHLGVLRALGGGLVGGFIPEQDTVNAAMHRLGLVLHRLDPEFNLIATGRHLADWRCGWMLHTAGAPKPAFRRRLLGWRREAIPDGAVWTRQPLSGRSLRLPQMAAQAARIAGQEARALDPDEMDIAPPGAFARLMPEGLAAIWIEPGGADAWPATGTFRDLAPGRWRLVAIPVPGQPLADCAFAARLPGAAPPLAEGRLAAEIVLDLPGGAAALDLALGGPGTGGAVAGLLLLRDPAMPIGDCQAPRSVPASA